MKWTQNQYDAINIPVSDIIVSAAAGSGKTAVMAERIISRLTGENSVDVDKILVVTYTNAAASEIKERVMKKIVEKLSESNDDALQRQLLLINNSHFCTIHSFCLELIKKYFYKLGVDPSVKTGDETDIELLLCQAAETVVNEYFSAGDEGFISLMESYGNNKESVLQKLIIDVYKFSRTMPDSMAWLDSVPLAYSAEGTDSANFIMECAFLCIDYAIAECKKAIEIINDSSCCTEWLGNIELEKRALEKLLSCKNYNEIYEPIYALSFDRLPNAKNVEDKALKEEIKAYRDSVKKIVDDVRKGLVCVSPADIAADNTNVMPKLKKLVELVKRTGEVFDGLKREKNLIDFSDYEHMALSLLRNPDGTPSDVAHEVSAGFEEIYIDEYQDCNNIQNTIFGYISGSIRGVPNIFCVGDMKQSIYRFRDANPLNFRAKCDNSPIFDGKTVNPSNKILLNSNFRSRQSVLDYTNSVFSQLMSEKCGELEYNDDESLKYGGGYIDVNPDIERIDIDIISETDDFGDCADDGKKTVLPPIEAEAAHIADKIRSYIDGGYMLYDKKNGIQRPARYSDIVILLRAPKSYISSFEKIFAEFKIPLYCDCGSGYFNTEEIEFLMSFLKIIDNSDDDIALASVMKNPVFGFDENDLLTIRLGGGKGSFYRCINSYIGKHTDDISQKLCRFISLLEKYHNESRYMETCEFLDFLISDINYFVYLSTFPDAKSKKANVRYLINKAKDFEESNFKGISSFVRYIENISDSRSAESAKSLGADDNMVRVMSIHKSKGLEFPIVFLSGLGKRFNMMDVNSRVVIHKDLGLGVDAIYTDKGYRVPTLNKISVRQKLKFETVSEELRVLYVALTRPTEKLILTGGVADGASLLNSIERNLKIQDYKLSPYAVSKSKNFLEMILMASMRSEGFESGSFEKGGIRVKDNVRYNFTLKNISDISVPGGGNSVVAWEKVFEAVTEDYDKISKTLSYSYPFGKLVSIPGNLTVTEIKRMSSSEDEANLFGDINLPKPQNFASGSSIYGSVFGTLVHLCMEKLDLCNIADENAISAGLNKLLHDGLISEDERNAVDVSKISAFGKSTVGQRLAAAGDRVRKEFSFKYMVNASEFFDVDTSDQIIVQGTIDAYFEDDDGSLVLVDYKTDKVKNGDTSAIAQRYQVQLDCYAKALEHIVGKKVKEKIIYLFDTDEAIYL